MRLPLSSSPRHNFGTALLILALAVSIIVAVMIFTIDTESATEPAPMFNQPSYKVPVLGGIGLPSGLDCEEDAVIGFLAPDTVGCLHDEDSIFSVPR